VRDRITVNVVVIYGTAEARKIVSRLEASGLDTLTAVASEYGGVAVRPDGDRVIRACPEQDWWNKLLKEREVGFLVDATHPFGSALSEAAYLACARAAIPFLRFYRPETKLPDSPLIHAVAGFEEAARVAGSLGETIFLTTGSGNLEVFLDQPAVQGKRVVVRVLPEARLISRCRELGVQPRDIVGLQGPFSVRFNQAIFAAYGAQVIVTREGGRSSGTLSKIKAALHMDMPVVIILRPANPRIKPDQVCYSSHQVVERVLGALAAHD